MTAPVRHFRRAPPQVRLRPLGLGDIAAVAECIRDHRFSYPLLTGGLGRRPSRGRAFIRAAGYVATCVAGNRLGGLLFGHRLHWIMAIEAEDGRFAGVVMIDELQRHRPGEPRHGTRFLKRPELRLPLRRGDGELGFFLHPDRQGQGYGRAASVALIRMLNERVEADGSPLLQRVWAETGRTNLPARHLLERLGLMAAREIGVTALDRFERDGERVDLVHYGDPALAVAALLEADRGPRTDRARRMVSAVAAQ